MDNKKNEKGEYTKPVVRRSFLPNIKILTKENFYTKEPVKVLRIALFRKVWFYHLTFKRLL